jgi:hypothetical protein
MFAKPEPIDLADLRAFSALCNGLREAGGYPKQVGLARCI